MITETQAPEVAARDGAAVCLKNGPIAIRPRKLIGWTDISRDLTRLTFD